MYYHPKLLVVLFIVFAVVIAAISNNVGLLKHKDCDHKKQSDEFLERLFCAFIALVVLVLASILVFVAARYNLWVGLLVAAVLLFILVCVCSPEHKKHHHRYPSYSDYNYGSHSKTEQESSKESCYSEYNSDKPSHHTKKSDSKKSTVGKSAEAKKSEEKKSQQHYSSFYTTDSS